MNRNHKSKMVSYAIAAGVLIATTSISTVGAPLAGASAVVSGSDSSYSTLAGINLTLANMVADANHAVNTSSSDTDSVEAVVQVVQTAEEAKSEYANIGIAQVTDYVNVRGTASEEGEVVGKLYNNSACEVSAEENGWYKITSGNCEGYVKCEFVVVGDEELARSASRRVATVNADTLYIREEASSDSSVIGMLPNGDDITVVDESTAESGWIKVSAEEGDGYVSTEFVTLATEYTYAESKAEEEARLAREEAERKAAQEAAEKAAAKQKAAQQAQQAANEQAAQSYSAPSGGNGSAVVNYACQFVGNPYVYGGSSLTNGTDCSGFVMSVYSAFGVGLPHSSSADRGVGYGVSVADMQPGDIVCYSGHVGIYAGNGTIVHAANESLGITYSNVYYRDILAVRRIF